MFAIVSRDVFTRLYRIRDVLKIQLDSVDYVIILASEGSLNDEEIIAFLVKLELIEK